MEEEGESEETRRKEEGEGGVEGRTAEAKEGEESGGIEEEEGEIAIGEEVALERGRFLTIPRPCTFVSPSPPT